MAAVEIIADGTDCRHRHNGITDPVYPADENLIEVQVIMHLSVLKT